MTTLNAALNYHFASTESARIASGASGAQDTIAEQIKQASANSPYQVGATITAKYQYKVGDDGSLIPQQTTITHTAPDEDAYNKSGGGRQRAYHNDDRRSSLSDLVNPKMEMSPTDEVGLFATATSAPSTPVNMNITPSVSATTPVQQAEVLDENGDSVEAELITGTSNEAEAEQPANNSSFLSLLAQRAQTAAANLYARNNDITYSTTPIAQIAA